LKNEKNKRRKTQSHKKGKNSNNDQENGAILCVYLNKEGQQIMEETTHVKAILQMKQVSKQKRKNKGVQKERKE